MNRKNKTFHRCVIICAALVFVIGVLPMSAVVVPNSQSSTNTGLGAAEYRVGQMGDAIADVGKDAFDAVSNAFQGAFDMFDDGYNPTSHVVNENGYYSQTYSNNNGRNASIFVGDDNKAYSVGYPIYDSWNTVGGVEKTGYPIANAYEVDGDYYQNFTNGYVRYADSEDLSFFPSKRVNEKGVEVPYTNTATRSRDNVNDDNNHDVTNRRSVDSTDNITKNANNNGTTNNNSDHANLSGTGADASGRAGSLEATSGINPILAIIGLIILAAAVILLVSLSVAASKNNN